MPVEIDSTLVERAIARAEVLSIFFPWLGQAIILDTRHDAETAPAVFADGIAGSAEERLRKIGHLRPQFPRPTRLMAVGWPAGVGSFVDSGAYGRLVQRLNDLGCGYLEVNCRRALTEIERAERRIKLAYVRGDQCHTLYQRLPT